MAQKASTVTDCNQIFMRPPEKQVTNEKQPGKMKGSPRAAAGEKEVFRISTTSW